MSSHAGRSWLPRFVTLGIACLALAAPVDAAKTASKAEKRKAAEELVQEALHREIYGMSADRQQLLDQAAQLSADCAAAMWHRGYVRHRNQWVKAEDYCQTIGADPRLVAYRRIRASYPNTAQGQLALADWCRKRGLEHQERAHLSQVIHLDPDHAEARRRLGFRRVNGAWMRTAEIEATLRQLQQDRKDLAAWSDKMQLLLKGLHHRSERKRKSAEARLLAISDPRALVAMEQILARDSEPVAQLVVRAVSNMPQHEAALCLARLAVFSPWQDVRATAARRLRERPVDSYVPALLASMYTPVRSRMEVSPGPGGRLLYRHSFFREGQNENQLLILDTSYRRIALPDGNRRETLARALDRIADSAMEAEMNVAQQNRRTAELNGRISEALSLATRQVIPDRPESWWQWWTQYNEVYVEGPKRTRTLRQQREIEIVDLGHGVSQGGGGQSASAGQVAAPLDCLAGGTLIWTAAGAMPVEKIQVGDLVLSQNAQTGELAYQPVLRTTVRPPSLLVQFTAGGETIEASGGHTFWVSGEGWVKARQLKPGMELHSVTRTVRVGAVERSREDPTYNVVVADFHTYFVGESKVLSHDNTIREPTNAIVPGLIEP